MSSAKAALTSSIVISFLLLCTSVSHSSSLTIIPNGNIFVCANDGVYRSINNGKSWVSMGLENYGIAFLANDSQGKIYAANGMYGNVYVSKNRGRTWANIYNCPGWITALSVGADDYVYIGTWNGGIYRFADNDGTLILPDANTNAFAFHPKGYMFAGDGYGGVDRFHAGSWDKVGTEISSVGFFGINPKKKYILAGPGHDGMYRSLDYGYSWYITNTGLSAHNVRVVGISQTSGYIFAGAGDGIYRSTNNGLNWAKINKSPSSIGIRALAIHPKNDYLFAWIDGSFGQKEGVYRSKDGNTWKHVFNED